MIVVAIFVQDFRLYFRSGSLRPMRHPRELITRFRTSSNLPSPNVAAIAPWMTFHYLGYIFHLPPAYLKQALNITDTRYPNFSLQVYARSSHTDIQNVLQRVREAIQGAAPNTASTPTSR
ncbi:MAG: hypothetical protein HY219_02250 [Candidatus Staskawiczbacteria bacterium]|nr:hypothetical protein [Candidatus Staskawiczbacteria bacterium]